MLAEEGDGAAAGERALSWLLEGNRRFASGGRIYPNQDAAYRRSLVQQQTPIALVLACFDSRVAPEHVFDQGLGDLLVMRLPGNVVDDTVIAGVEFSAAELNVPLVFVLGHSGCRAVEAVREVIMSGAFPRGHLGTLVYALRTAVEATRAAAGDVLGEAVRANVAHQVHTLRGAEPLIADFVRDGRLVVRGGVYRLDSGLIEVTE